MRNPDEGIVGHLVKRDQTLNDQDCIDFRLIHRKAKKRLKYMRVTS
jgi:non-homologous end joining protein Ku